MLPFKHNNHREGKVTGLILVLSECKNYGSNTITNSLLCCFSYIGSGHSVTSLLVSAPEMTGTFSSCLHDVSKLEVIEVFFTFGENSDPDIVLGHSGSQ